MIVTRGERSEALPSAIILIPAFNEASTIADVIGDIRTHTDIPVIVIDDASTDETVSISRNAGATVITLTAQLGAWGATQTGLRYALRHGYEVAICMDADGQHEAASLLELKDPVDRDIADVSIGACTQRGSLLRKAAWVMLKQASGLSLEDVTSGFRVYNRRAIRELSSWRATLLDYQDIGVLLLLQSCGLRIVDVEVAIQPRRDGGSRLFHSWLIVAFYMCQTLLLGLTKRKLARSHQNTQLGNQS